MSVRNPNVAVAVQAWSDSSRHMPISPAVTDLLARFAPNRTSTEEQLARRAFMEGAAGAVQQLIDAHETPDAAIVYATTAFAELLGRVVGSAHDEPCRSCMEANFRFLKDGYLAGFFLQIREQQTAQSVA